MSKKPLIIFNISGGAGKNIMATAVVHELRKKYVDAKIIITTPWDIIWENNPDIDLILNLEKTPFFYRDYIKDKDAKIFRLDPYSEIDYFYRYKHLIEIWGDLCGVSLHDLKPRLYFTDTEKNDVNKKLAQTETVPKPIFFIQASGGASNQPYPVSWARDLPLPIAEEIVEGMNKSGYRTIQIRRENQPSIKGTDWINFSLREALCALQFSDKRLFVDSVAQHAAAALDLPSVVAWITNSPNVFGYKIHTNILPDAHMEFRHHIDAYLEPYNIAGVWHEHPYNNDRIFDVEKILSALLKK